ncbi:transaldolase family protein [Nonomuraea sp. M3C6]|uniref:Transaldolase family protein n=1 Tax=Nonomuraea marmarensis TaxID=3351344 RepID=A0ABW7ALG2_9ACTN
MSLYLDSADLGDARSAAASGIAAGITTNPALMSKVSADHVTHLSALLDAFPAGKVFYQLTATDADQAAQEIAAIDRLGPGDRERVVFKLAAQPWLYAIGAQLSAAGSEVAFTAVYSPGQVLCAAQAGARWVIGYVDRAARLDGADGPLVSRLAPFVPDGMVLLAASIKSTEQAVQAVRDGAGGVTTSWTVLSSLMRHPLTDSAVDEFRAAVRGS